MDIRDTARVTARFVRRGALADPSTVSMIVTPPGDSDIAEYTVAYPHADLTKVEVGVYEGLVPVPAAGRWRITMVGTGSANGGGMQTIFVYE